ncbi:aminotransferase class I/II-fold pyridoxal phosphate-dependent enzyme [bacterium]|nr:aminotransferase class I/II-fold pyridoxal phosphate-dependent enzyme [bacterium]
MTAAGTFSEYGFVSHLMDGQVVQIPLTPDFRFDLTAMADAITSKTRLIFIANPNNPTGTIVTDTELRLFMAQVPPDVAVILDEAYAEFVTSPEYPDSISLLAHYPNLIVTRTFSKLYGLAGFRIGYAVASPDVIATLYKVRQPFNVNSIALAAAEIAIQNTKFVQKTLENNDNQKKWLMTELSNLGFNPLPSEANFICVMIGAHAKDIAQLLMRQGIIVRHLASFGMPEAIRITIGTPEQNARLLEQLKKSV